MNGLPVGLSVKEHKAFTSMQQTAGQMCSDKACATGNHDCHGCSPPSWLWSASLWWSYQFANIAPARVRHTTCRTGRAWTPQALQRADAHAWLAWGEMTGRSL